MSYDDVKLCKKCKANPSLSGKSYCSACSKAYHADYFQKHSSEKSASASSLKRDILKWYKGLKHNKNCMACMQGPFDECQLDYDHIPSRGVKFMDISRMVRLGYSREKIQLEIEKCQLICSNCHRLRTRNRRVRI